MKHEIYPVINILKNGRYDVSFVASVLKKLSPKYLQIRMKESPLDEIIKVSKEIVALRNTLKISSAIIVNDSVEAALKSGADGVHLGQTDTSPQQVKSFCPGLITGLSTHCIKQVYQANSLTIDYIGFGPVFKSSTKSGHSAPVAVSAPEVIKISTHPVVFIGGINKKNIETLPDGDNISFAVVSALNEFLQEKSDGRQSYKHFGSG